LGKIVGGILKNSVFDLSDESNIQIIGPTEYNTKTKTHK